MVVPTSHVDQLWREYEQLENSGSNKTLARRMLDEWRPKYQSGAPCGVPEHGWLAMLRWEQARAAQPDLGAGWDL